MEAWVFDLTAVVVASCIAVIGYIGVVRAMFLHSWRWMGILAIVGFPTLGVLIALAVGGTHCRPWGLVPLMRTWTISILTAIAVFFVQVDYGHPLEFPLAIMRLCLTAGLLVWCLVVLSRTLQTSHWIESLRREPTPELVRVLASRGAYSTSLLAESLTDEEPDVRTAAADALGLIGAGAIRAVPALRDATEDPHATVRAAAVEAIRRIEGGSSDEPVAVQGDPVT